MIFWPGAMACECTQRLVPYTTAWRAQRLVVYATTRPPALFAFFSLNQPPSLYQPPTFAQPVSSPHLLEAGSVYEAL